MKNVKVTVTSHDERGDPSPPDNYTVEIQAGAHRFMLGFYAFTSKERATQIAAEVRALLGLRTTPATVTLQDTEKAKADEFTLSHGCRKGFSIQFEETGVGTKKVIRCGDCGEEKDISDYESW